MRRAAIAPALGLALALAPLAAPAFARADVLTAPKIACVPLNVTHCSGPGKCKTRPAGAKDKTEVLVIDFRTKTATIRTGGKSRSFAEIAHERPERGEGSSPVDRRTRTGSRVGPL